MAQLVSLWVLVLLACIVMPGATGIFIAVGVVLTLLGTNWEAFR